MSLCSDGDDDDGNNVVALLPEHLLTPPLPLPVVEKHADGSIGHKNIIETTNQYRSATMDDATIVVFRGCFFILAKVRLEIVGMDVLVF
jgi:hypothetical protein